MEKAASDKWKRSKEYQNIYKKTINAKKKLRVEDTHKRESLTPQLILRPSMKKNKTFIARERKTNGGDCEWHSNEMKSGFSSSTLFYLTSVIGEWAEFVWQSNWKKNGKSIWRKKLRKLLCGSLKIKLICINCIFLQIFK